MGKGSLFPVTEQEELKERILTESIMICNSCLYFPKTERYGVSKGKISNICPFGEWSHKYLNPAQSNAVFLSREGIPKKSNFWLTVSETRSFVFVLL